MFLPFLVKIIPPIIKIANDKITISISCGEPIVIGLVVFVKALAMFGITIAES